jgi:hypothetical protein
MEAGSNHPGAVSVPTPEDVLHLFHPVIARWFHSAFETATAPPRASF